MHNQITKFNNEIGILKKYLIEKGYAPGQCVDVIDHVDGSLVIHYAVEMIKDGDFFCHDTPGTVAVILDRNTGRISVPELL